MRTGLVRTARGDGGNSNVRLGAAAVTISAAPAAKMGKGAKIVFIAAAAAQTARNVGKSARCVI